VSKDPETTWKNDHVEKSDFKFGKELCASNFKFLLPCYARKKKVKKISNKNALVVLSKVAI